MRRLLIILIFIIPEMSLAQESNHIFVFLNSKPDKEVISDEEKESLQAAHMKNIERLVSEGKMIVAGPFEKGGGIFIFKSSSVAETKHWLSSDPAVRANRWNIEMYPIRFISGNACLAKEPYEMVTYGFTRVRLINDIASYKMNQGSLDIWSGMEASGNVIMVGSFPQSDGGIIVYRKDQADFNFAKEQRDHIRLEHKLLWVAKGSFCE